MDNAFDYSCPATGRNFAGRVDDRRSLTNFISNGEHIAIYSPSKTGRHSLIQQTILDLRAAGIGITPVIVNLQDIRTREDFFIRLREAIIKAFKLDPHEYPDSDDPREILKFPFRMATEKLTRILLVFDEFQKLDTIEDSYHLFKALEEVIREIAQSNGNKNCAIVMTGGEVNAMKEIFEVRKDFFRLVQIHHMSQLTEKEIIDHIHLGLASSGKVVDDELLFKTCKLFKNNIWYINHFMTLCDYLAKGYIMLPILQQALDMILAIHEPHFRLITNDLTGFQLQYIKAILDGHRKFSSVEVISGYGLNSSANVKRVREALIKKEIITFNDKDEPIIMDPLYEYWIKNKFFIPLQS